MNAALFVDGVVVVVFVTITIAIAIIIVDAIAISHVVDVLSFSFFCCNNISVYGHHIAIHCRVSTKFN